MAHNLALFATLVLLVRSACEAESVHPAKALYAECEALRSLAGHGPPANYKAKHAPAIKACREKVIAYTKTHQGGDLDRLNWGNAIQSIYDTSAASEWRTYEESEANVREAWKMLAQLTLEPRETAADLSLAVASWHIADWSTLAPEACAAFLDEIDLTFMEKVSPEALAAWKWISPNFEERTLIGAQTLPPERLAALWRRRDARLVRSLQDESIPLKARSENLASYATQLYGQGDAERAATLLDAWWARYGESIQTEQFYSARFHIACYGCGDWSKAREALRHMDKLVATGAISADEGLYQLVAANYYKNIAHSEYELQRRAVIFNAARKKETSSPAR